MNHRFRDLSSTRANENMTAAAISTGAKIAVGCT
jgi:hypothetical protein